MAEDRKEASLEEIEKASGGIVHRGCRHKNKIPTGNNKSVNGVVYYELKCDKCGEVFWEKITELTAAATEE